jgi:hypothetical protein
MKQMQSTLGAKSSRYCLLSKVWNLCATITGAYRKGCDDERRRVLKLFLDGKLKKRKRQGGVGIEVLGEGMTICESEKSAT